MDIEEIKKYFSYCPETGEFTWLVNHRPRGKKGAIAGSINRIIGYRYLSLAGEKYLAHRLAWAFTYGYFPVGIDHKNGSRCDNRIENLVEADQSKNMRNTVIRSDNTSGCTGVSWCKRSGKWLVRIVSIKGKEIQIGLYADKDKAISARKQAEAWHGYSEHHGRKA